MKKFLALFMSVMFVVFLPAIAEESLPSSDDKEKAIVYMEVKFEKDEETGVIHVKHMYPFEVEEGTENPFLFIEGDFIHLLGNSGQYPELKNPVIENAEMAAKIARAVTFVDSAYPGGVLTRVYHDVETNIWIVRFCEWPLVAGGSIMVAMSGEDARIIKIWGNK